MPIGRFERAYLWLAVAVCVGLTLAIFASVVFADINLPGPAGRVDPNHLADYPPFDQPGLREVGDGEYEAVVIARAWSFTPNEITVPVGSTVRFLVTSADLIHGFYIKGALVNGMVIPGQVTDITAEFKEPGIYRIVCHEYCGLGHHGMYGTVVVEER